MQTLPSYGLSRGVGWFDTDVSELPICFIFKGQAAQEEEEQIDRRRWDRQEVPKRRCQSTVRRVTTQKMQDVILTAAKALIKQGAMCGPNVHFQNLSMCGKYCYHCESH